ncbi:hypothetical protein P152DRAFT_515164 [Eremomyces bilateralis CBS 781.70]|uniref:AMMECR1 domain-containing protein n=1 Tax=Eremomyces bilateralis CBS 781.70 TaxID=1392243 RepID=A0A6G1FZE5_9PEZI|nr:uncharacterized protein P152DRAFT_515164 [Eremomyces bilateralis CBS 781.70]KAF1811164.1 hypothetical protein P152DRAFT_515164 [Eremomyces bilateralis CBS 781.70]
MATQAHCAYCFECLSASLEKRRPLGLAEVEELWDKYETGSQVDDLQTGHHDVDEDEDMDGAPIRNLIHPASHQPQAISRLLAPSPSTASASSSSIPSTTSSTTPSTSVSDSTSTPPTSKSASRSSFFSIPRRLRRLSRDQSHSIAAPGDHPLFVTWNTVSRSEHKSLRGCIGTFEPQELDDGLRSYALTSAFDDTRFNPIVLSELPTLECGVTLLTNFEPAPGPLGWEVGVHGIRISFIWHGRKYGATYLPDVAKEQGWTKEETMVSLMRKAGWTGRRDEWRRVLEAGNGADIVRYQGKRIGLLYEEWKEFHEWVNGLEKRASR